MTATGTPIPDPVISAIKAELGARGMTQRDLALAAGISEKHLSQLLTGKATTSLQSLTGILEPLELTYNVQSVHHRGSLNPNAVRAAMGLPEYVTPLPKPEVEFVEKLSLEHLGRQVLIGGFVENGAVRFRADTAIAGTLVGLRPGKAAQGDNPGTRILVVAQGSQAAPLETGNRTTVVIEGRPA
jgi:transcriptional regulator with XRE-family HTH domain